LLSQCLKAIGVRLEEILIDDALCNDDFEVQNLDEQRQRLLMEEDENEDFLVEGCFCFFICYSTFNVIRICGTKQRNRDDGA